MTTRTALLAGGVALLALTTAGCGIKFLPIDTFDSPIAIQRDGETLRIAICEDVEVTKLWATERNVGDGRDWDYFLRAEGSAKLTSGAEFDMHNVPVGLEVSLAQDPRFSDGFEIEVVILSENEDPRSLRAMFSVPAGETLEADEWLQSDGTITGQPCNSTPVHDRRLAIPSELCIGPTNPNFNHVPEFEFEGQGTSLG